MKKQIGMMAVAVVAAISVVGAASAQQEQPVPPMGGGRGESILRELLQIVADDLSLEPAAVIEQLQDQTLADVITSNGGSIESISAEITAAVTERINAAVEAGTITQERADTVLGNLTQTIDSAINGEFQGLRGRLRPGLRGEQGQQRGGMRNLLRQDARPLISAAADVTGLTALEIAQEMRAGSTLGEVITANGSTPEAVIATALESVQATLDEAVTNGRVTQEQADAMLSGVQAFYEAAMSGGFRAAPTDASVAVDAAL